MLIKLTLISLLTKKNSTLKDLNSPTKLYIMSITNRTHSNTGEFVY